jgi:hypothetical protein
MAWLQLLGIARTRVVDRLCNFESPAADADHQAQVAAASGIGRGEDHSAAAAAVASLAVLDRQSVEDVCFERASMGNPACSEDLVVPCRAFDPTARFETHRSRSFHTSSNLNVR